VSAEHGQARIDEGRIDVVGDPDIERLRAAITLTADPEVAFDSTRMTVTLRDGRRLDRTVEHCVGSTRSPMSDKDIHAKFVSQAGLSIGQERASELVETLWRVETVADASTLAAAGRGPGASEGPSSEEAGPAVRRQGQW
jgi:2-methylcitrate dehydratase PrpD